MTKRRTGPPLYELIHSRPQPRTERREPVVAAEPISVADRPTNSQNRLGPGRMISIPVGYAFVAGAIGVGLIAASFMLGHRSAENSVRAEFEAAWLSRVEGIDNGRPQDPLMVVSPGTIRSQDSAASSGAPSTASEVPRQRQAGANDLQTGWGPVMSDPRERGRMYFVLMETRREGAERLANFLRGEGLEAYVVPVAGKSIHRVITLPALTSSSRDDPTVADLRRKIEQAGLRWQLSGGHDNLSGAYIRTH